VDQLWDCCMSWTFLVAIKASQEEVATVTRHWPCGSAVGLLVIGLVGGGVGGGVAPTAVGGGVVGGGVGGGV